MVKITWQLKKVKGDLKKPEFEVVNSGDILGDRALMVTVNKNGDCGMVALGMSITEALGAIRECLDSDLWMDRDFIKKTNKEVTLAIDIHADEAQPEKVEHLEYIRAIIIVLKEDDDDEEVHCYNITRPEGKGILEMTLMLQLLTMGMQNALTQAATRPQAARMMPPLGPSGFGGVTGRLIPPR
ncbi:MAG: hypothetical protein PHO67_07975 [Candidatus Omnitrophica bacterium]|nr:hypothetical protein [Candidatus Omnitrophota bacterium]